MSEQQWRITFPSTLPIRYPETFWAPSRHIARRMATATAVGRSFILEPICPHCDQVIAAGEPLGDDGRYCHPACMHEAVR